MRSPSLDPAAASKTPCYTEALKPLESFKSLSDPELVEVIDRLALSERQATTCLIASLVELDSRRLYLGLGYPSLFAYCTERLHLSEHAALNRIETARAANVFPVILERLAEGALTLTAIRLLRPLLTHDNHVEVLDKARHLGKQKVLELMARLRPQAPLPATVRKLPVSRAPELSAPVKQGPVGPELSLQLLPTPVSARVQRTPVIAPLSEQHYKVQVTFSAMAHDKLRRAQALMRHQPPSGDDAVILERALDTLLVELMKKKAAAVQRPRDSRLTNDTSRHIPAVVRRKVWARDAGRCAFSSADGRRCSETARLEYHHVEPYAVGGRSTVDNIELRCRAHNTYEAERFFGQGPAIVKETELAYR